MRESGQKSWPREQISNPQRANNDMDFLEKSFFTIIVNQIPPYYIIIDFFFSSLTEERNRGRSMITFAGLCRVTEHMFSLKHVFTPNLFAAPT